VSRVSWRAPAPEQLESLRELFEAFERKQDILHLLERCASADGVQIFIGEEAGVELLGDYSLITAPYGDGARTLGVLGVIGPTRMAYDRVIPIVDVTSRHAEFRPVGLIRAALRTLPLKSVSMAP
jgi:heat-inducible transcriptional repressor